MLYSVQYLRAVAVWLVVFHHFVQILIGFHQVSNGVEQFAAKYGSLGVDLFFVISGFIITVSVINKNESWWVFVKRRFFRIVPTYWFYTLLLLGLVVLLEGFYGYQDVSWLFVVKSLLFVPENSPVFNGYFPLLTVGWTLNYEMYFYGIFAVSLGFARFFRYSILFLSLLIIILTTLLQHFCPESFYASNLVYEFVLGSWVGLAYLRGWLNFSNIVVSITLIGLGVVYIYFRAAGHHYLLTGIPMAIILIGSISLERFCKDGILSKLGDISYSTYLSHAIILFIFKDYLLTMVSTPYALLLPLGFLVFIVSWLTYEIIEKGLYFNLKKRGFI